MRGGGGGGGGRGRRFGFGHRRRRGGGRLGRGVSPLDVKTYQILAV